MTTSNGSWHGRAMRSSSVVPVLVGLAPGSIVARHRQTEALVELPCQRIGATVDGQFTSASVVARIVFDPDGSAQGFLIVRSRESTAVLRATRGELTVDRHGDVSWLDLDLVDHCGKLVGALASSSADSAFLVWEVVGRSVEQFEARSLVTLLSR